MRRLFAAAAAACLCSAAPPRFDYYVFSLSWSPEYCAGGNSSEQCTGNRRYEFVVHGLWPQDERGGYPSNCAGTRQVPRRIIDEMIEIMPSAQLIRHEWQKHGTCSGLSQQDYFQRVQDAYVLVRIPNRFRQPLRQVETTATDVKREFTNANPGFSFTVACRGRFIREVRTCMDRDLAARGCGTGVSDSCPAGTIILRPVR
ncbi:MAG TPA: ribonuclease T2 [Bryobacteraceae bacterium]|nr:ribonuclease T2 [Bryobacteraceae bacterium]